MRCEYDKVGEEGAILSVVWKDIDTPATKLLLARI
jgi:hypothetical protein